MCGQGTVAAALAFSGAFSGSLIMLTPPLVFLFIHAQFASMLASPRTTLHSGQHVAATSSTEAMQYAFLDSEQDAPKRLWQSTVAVDPC